jgi:hypothetical protein
VRPQRGHPAVELLLDVDGVPGERRGQHQHLAHTAPRLADLGEEPVVGRVADGVQGSQADRAVVGHVEVAAREGLVVVDRDHHFGPVSANRRREVAAQRHAVADEPVRMVEKLDDLDADLGRRGALLRLAEWAALRGRERVDSRLSARSEEVGDVPALGRPAGDGGRTTVLQIVRMGDDGEPAFEVLREG